jgi:N-acylneuraminate cytidylyltransferase/CMP-N,N'-diacetyllegionaminic acid synthase
MEKYYRPNGGMYIGWSNFIKKYRNFFCNRTKGYVMDKVSSLDINDLLDMKVAETILKENYINCY